MPFSMTTPPVILPVTVDEVKAHCVIPAGFKDDDKLLELYIKSATVHGQILTGRQFVQAGFSLELDRFSAGKVKVLPELQAVTTVKYTDGDGLEVTLDPAIYKVKKTGLRGYIEPVTAWPADAWDVVIEFTAGWPPAGAGTDANPWVSTTPEDIKSWIMVRVAGAYEQREAFILSKSGSFGVAPMPKSFVDHILDCRVVPGLGAGI